MRKNLFRFFKKSSLLSLSLLIVFSLCFLLFSKPLSIELKIDPKLKNQAEFSKTKDQILSYLKKYQSHFIWQLSLKEMIKNIEKMSLGLEVYIYRRYPNKLIIGLSEKKTALLLLTNNSDFYSVSYNGSLGTKKETLNILNVPILRGGGFESNKKLRKKALELLKPIPKQEKIFSIENISEVLYDKKLNSFLIYLSTRPLVIKLNSPPLNQKVKNIEFVLEYLKKEEKTHALIDARFDKKIIVKKKI